jgi:hypothetical protein
MLPIGVVIPTRNCAALVPAHLAAMRSWADQVEEILVVDSASTDGTLDLLQAGLRHPCLKFLQHPPGLYQSWNFGISQVKAEYCYMSTVGETITLDGLQHLVQTAKQFDCDVVISKPTFVTLEGRPMKAWRWPIDGIVHSLSLSEPQAFEGLPLFLFTLVHYGEAILGSSASNLYRARCLQTYPFPTDYGTVGDGGWGLENCFRFRLGVTPRVFSTFREHPKSYTQAEYAVHHLGRKMFDRICLTYREEAARNPKFAAVAAESQVPRMVELLERHLHQQEALERHRRGPLNWGFKPAAWLCRFRRNATRREVARLKAAALRRLFPAAR